MSFSINKTMKQSLIKIICLLLIIGLNWTGILAIGRTLAYFNDIEKSPANVYSAGSLDFSFNNTNFSGIIGLNDKLFFSSVLTNAGTIDWQYAAGVEKVGGSDNFCNSLILNVELNGVEKYDGNLMSFNLPSSSKTIGTWDFEIKLPVDAVGINQGDSCVFDLVFRAWQSDAASYEDSGFSDEEKIRINLTANMIVLNEFLPNPDSSANGFNFGDDSDQMPKGEWVELYNNSSFDIDLSGYYLTDADGHRIDIEPCRTNTGDTVIAKKGFLVVYRNGGEDCNSHNFSLNNDADTVNLFSPNRKLDSYSYNNHNYCQLEPTPNDENSDTANTGVCEEIPPNKSYARIPDGIGGWVDPIPTPGAPNELIQNNEAAADINASVNANDDTNDDVNDDIFSEQNVGGVDALLNSNSGESDENLSLEAIINEISASAEVDVSDKQNAVATDTVVNVAAVEQVSAVDENNNNSADKEAVDAEPVAAEEAIAEDNDEADNASEAVETKNTEASELKTEQPADEQDDEQGDDVSVKEDTPDNSGESLDNDENDSADKKAADLSESAEEIETEAVEEEAAVADQDMAAEDAADAVEGADVEEDVSKDESDEAQDEVQDENSKSVVDQKPTAGQQQAVLQDNNFSQEAVEENENNGNDDKNEAASSSDNSGAAGDNGNTGGSESSDGEGNAED